MSERIEFARPQKRQRKGRDPLERRAPLLRGKHLLGIALIAGIAAASMLIGFPHLRWSYDYVDRGEPFYLTCRYAGPTGLITIRPPDGSCPLIKLLTGRP